MNNIVNPHLLSKSISNSSLSSFPWPRSTIWESLSGSGKFSVLKLPGQYWLAGF